MIKKILFAIVAVIAAFLVVAALQPSDYRVERSITIAAPPAAIFPEVNDLHQMQDWSPWKKFDPEAKNTYEGPPAGEGAVFTWSGNSQAGEGRMTVIESRPDEVVRMNLEFIRPFPSNATAEYTFKAQDGGTMVTWAMFGPKNFMSKAFGLIMSMDKMIGKEFEEGLASLKRLVETKK